MKTAILKWETWVYGLLSGFIGGGASAITSSGLFAAAKASGLDVQPLNFKEMGLLWLGGGVWTAASYLAKSPLPEIVVAETTKEETTTTVHKVTKSQDETKPAPPGDPNSTVSG